jgi:hypothetical protein
MPGVAAIEGPPHARMPGAAEALGRALASAGMPPDAKPGLPLLVSWSVAIVTAGKCSIDTSPAYNCRDQIGACTAIFCNHSGHRAPLQCAARGSNADI